MTGTSTPCPICGTAARVWIAREGRTLLRCTACPFAWMQEGVMRTGDGRSIYEAAGAIFLDGSQADYYQDETSIDSAREKLTWVESFAPRGGALLDVGANIGLFVREAARSFDALGIEPSAAIVRHAVEHVGARLEAASIDEVSARYAGRFDAVTLFDVIEHLDAPGAGLAQIRGALRPGGHLFITTPDLGSLAARLTGSNWHYIDMDEHVSLFSLASLRALLHREGFDVRQARTIGRDYRFSYIRRRLHYLGQAGLGMRLAYLASWPLALRPQARLHINLGDVMGVVAVRRS
jgi:SAM-dependent methyltransferase